jgi:site-specific DNA-methyltransferase (adenine-specific)
MILYSSNPNDMVCDFFLGSFSTAKVTIGLGRKACGFEINKNAFDYQIQETNQIISEFHQLTRKGRSKKHACDEISNKYGRGYWSILNIIGNTPVHRKKRNNTF